jgi:hypothetical protein
MAAPQGFASPRQAQRFLSAFSVITPHFRLRLDICSPPESFRAGRSVSQAKGVGIVRIVSVHPAELRDL